MPKKIPPLSDTACRALRYNEGAGVRRIRDGGGLYLEALPSGRKVWRLEYRTSKGTKTRATFTIDYGKTGGTLVEARAWRDKLRAQIASGLDPNKLRKREAEIDEAKVLSTFNSVADEWLKHRRAGWSSATAKKVTGIIRRVLRPALGCRQLDDIAPADILAVLQPYDERGQTETAHRGCEYASAIYRHAMLRGVASSDPARPVRDALRPNTHRNHSHLTDSAEIGRLMRAIDLYDGHPSVSYSLKILPRVFTRPGELRLAQWGEFDLNAAQWTIPEGRMKARREHMVPLSRQVIKHLEELSDYSTPGSDGFLFPSLRAQNKPISDAAVSAALRSMGFTSDQITPHGFRHTASTQLHELGFESHVVERQLSHSDSNTIRGVYNKAEYWKLRADMMQKWADYLDELKGVVR